MSKPKKLLGIYKCDACSAHIWFLCLFDLLKGVDCIRNMVQSVLDKRLAIWEKYCLRHCFAVPQVFVMPKSVGSLSRWWNRFWRTVTYVVALITYLLWLTRYSYYFFDVLGMYSIILALIYHMPPFSSGNLKLGLFPLGYRLWCSRDSSHRLCRRVTWRILDASTFLAISFNLIWHSGSLALDHDSVFLGLSWLDLHHKIWKEAVISV